MTRLSVLAPLVLLAVLLTACSNSSKLDSSPRASSNLVCDRIAIEFPKATCVPEFTDVGDQHVHVARFTTEKGTAVCGMSMSQVSLACGDLIARPPSGPAPQPQQQQSPPVPVQAPSSTQMLPLPHTRPSPPPTPAAPGVPKPGAAGAKKQ